MVTMGVLSKINALIVVHYTHSRATTTDHTAFITRLATRPLAQPRVDDLTTAWRRPGRVSAISRARAAAAACRATRGRSRRAASRPSSSFTASSGAVVSSGAWVGAADMRTTGSATGSAAKPEARVSMVARVSRSSCTRSSTSLVGQAVLLLLLRLHRCCGRAPETPVCIPRGCRSHRRSGA